MHVIFAQEKGSAINGFATRDQHIGAPPERT
jgi:hypothetical protein